MRVVPAILAALLLGAHFLRSGNTALVIASLLLAVAAAVPVPALRVFCRVLLAAGSLVWVITAWELMQMRQTAGSPYLRMLAILVGVALFTALAAWLLPVRGKAGQV